MYFRTYSLLHSSKVNCNKNNNKEKWEEIIKNIVPSIDNLIGLEHPYIKECKTISDINKILDKFTI